VCGTDVALDLCNNTSIGVLLNTYQSKNVFRDIIRNNDSKKTGFVMSFSTYSISCIFKPSKKSHCLYCLVIYDETKSCQAQYIKNISNVNSLVDEIITIHRKYQSVQNNDYRIPFFVCSSQNVNESNQNKRKRFMKNQRARQSSAEIEPLKKKILLERKQTVYKHEWQSKLSHKYKTMNINKKQELSKKTAEKYRTMDSNKKTRFISQTQAKISL